MKKSLKTICLTGILMYCVLFQAAAWDAQIPKHNHGTLEEVEMADMPGILGVSLSEIVKLNLDNLASDTSHSYLNYHMNRASLYEPRVFKQTVPEADLVLYRATFKVKDAYRIKLGYFEDYTYQKIWFSEKGSRFSLCYEDFGNWEYSPQVSTLAFRTGVMALIRNGSFDGLMTYTLKNDGQTIYFDEADAPGHKGQKHIGEVHFFKGQKKVHHSQKADMSLEASNPLLDKKDLFRYTIQNAFDQNPATSYVEDTPDDLMKIDISYSNSFKKNVIEKMDSLGGFSRRVIINGYAENEYYYFANNRIKKVGRTIFKPDFLKTQETVFNDTLGTYGLVFRVKDIYPGRKYNDTCLSELNYQFKNGEWLLGNIND